MEKRSTLRLARGTGVVAVGVDVQAAGLVVGTVVGDGSGVALPEVLGQDEVVAPMGTPIGLAVDTPAVVTRTQVDNWKREAKRIGKAEGIPHHEALVRVAQAKGYRSWTALMREVQA